MSLRRPSSDGAPGAPTPADALTPLSAALDAVGPEPPITPALDAELNEWLGQLGRSGVLRTATLSDGSLHLLAALTPDASVTERCLSRLEAVRRAARGQLLDTRALEAECTAQDPGQLFRELRSRAMMNVDRAAPILGVPPAILIRIEDGVHPWHTLSADAMPAFAAAVAEPLERCLALLVIAARRAIFGNVKRRAAVSLGRIDEAQTPHKARLDTLRVVFARVADENRAAAEFITAARAAAQRAAGREGLT
jgi:hypothetical protein